MLLAKMKEAGSRVLLLPYSFAIFLSVQFLLIIFFKEALYRDYYYSWYQFFTQYFFWSILLLPVVIIGLAVKNFKHLKKLVAGDRFFIVFAVIALAVFVFLAWRGPVLVRLDKEVSTVRTVGAYDSGNFFQPRIDNLASFFGEAKARAYFLLLNFLSHVFPVTIVSLSLLSAGLFLFQGLLFYFIAKLVIKSSWLAFSIGLLFLLHPNNLLLGSAPDYVFAGQVFGVFSHLVLLLFIKYKDRALLIWSFSLLFFSLLLRIEMIFWLPVYFFLAWRLMDREEIIENRRLINSFLLIILPLVFSTVLGFFVKPIGSLAVMDSDFYSLEAIGGLALLGKIVAYYQEVFLKNFFYNLRYVFSTVPLVLALVPALHLYKKKEIQNYSLYFLFFFFAITLLHCNERIDSFNYLSYIVTPLVLLSGLALDHFSEGGKRFNFLAVMIAAIMGYLNFIYYDPAWLHKDAHTILWNKELAILRISSGEIKNNSAIILNDRLNLLQGLFDKKRDLAGRKIELFKAKKNLTGQFENLKKEYAHVYAVQGTAGYFRKGFSTFDNTEFKAVLADAFNYEVVVDKALARRGEIVGRGDLMGGDVDVFILELVSVKNGAVDTAEN